MHSSIWARPTFPEEVLEDGTRGKANWHKGESVGLGSGVFSVLTTCHEFFLRDHCFWKISAYQATKQILLAPYHLSHLPILLLATEQLQSCWSDILPNRTVVISDKTKESPGLGSPLSSPFRNTGFLWGCWTPGDTLPFPFVMFREL